MEVEYVGSLFKWEPQLSCPNNVRDKLRPYCIIPSSNLLILVWRESGFECWSMKHLADSIRVKQRTLDP